MTKHVNQHIEMHLIIIEDLVPMDHLLRKINDMIDFSFIYDDVENMSCSHNGRPSTDPMIRIKYLLIGFLYGSSSERRIAEKIQVNMAYRWFLGLDIMDKVPEHSAISQNRKRRFKDSGLFGNIFQKTVTICIENGKKRKSSTAVQTEQTPNRDFTRVNGKRRGCTTYRMKSWTPKTES